MILIYDDHIHNNASLMAAIQQIMPGIKVRFCDSHDIITNGILDKASLLIMPGGADLYYCEKLNGVGNNIIKSFVHNGGAYLGICAGAYYASTFINWDNGVISGARELAFYDGTCNGPVFEWVENGTTKKSWYAAPLIDYNGRQFPVCYNGGGVFSEPTGDDATVIARYADLPDMPPAIIEIKYGAGRVVLTSPHIERYGRYLDGHLYKHNNPSYEWENAAIRHLTVHTEQQEILWTDIMNRLIRHA